MEAKYAEWFIAICTAIMVSLVFLAAYSIASESDVRNPARAGILAAVSVIAIAAVIARILG